MITLKHQFVSLVELLLILTELTIFGSASVAAPKPATLLYSLHRSELITDLAMTGTLGLTQALIPLNLESQRLFPDNVNRLDRSIRDKWHTKSDNFLDGNGAFYTPIAAAIAIIGLDLIEGVPFEKTGNELLIFSNGLLANTFLTMGFKRGFSRRRPLLEFASDSERAALNAKAENHESFYSGHASTAFFSIAFLHRRVAQSLAKHGHVGIKSGYQWLAGITLYGWASYVGYSRIQIDKHYFTDVAMGALMGVLFEEVYYGFNRKHWNWSASWSLTPQVTPTTVQLYFAKRF